MILAKVLSNRKPPYSLAGGLYDVLKDTDGDCFAVSNDEIVSWIIRVMKAEGYDLLPAAATAVAAVAKALDQGQISPSDTVMLNVTGAGMLQAMSKGYIEEEPLLVLDPALPAEEIIAKVDALF